MIALSGLLGADTQTSPTAGQPAPDFSLPSVEGGLVSSKDYKGKWGEKEWLSPLARLWTRKFVPVLSAFSVQRFP